MAILWTNRCVDSSSNTRWFVLYILSCKFFLMLYNISRLFIHASKPYRSCRWILLVLLESSPLTSYTLVRTWNWFRLSGCIKRWVYIIRTLRWLLAVCLLNCTVHCAAHGKFFQCHLPLQIFRLWKILCGFQRVCKTIVGYKYLFVGAFTDQLSDAVHVVY